MLHVQLCVKVLGSNSQSLGNWSKDEITICCCTQEEVDESTVIDKKTEKY